jgi:hypothetical protein
LDIVSDRRSRTVWDESSLRVRRKIESQPVR